MSKSKHVISWRKRTKNKLVIYKGGACVICGYNKCQGALEFHHLDPNEKDFGIASGGTTRSWANMKAEADKCILVCSNCHSEIHAGLVDPPNINIDGASLLKEAGWNPETGRSIIAWPTRPELKDMIEKEGQTKTASKIGVSRLRLINYIEVEINAGSIDDFAVYKKTKIQWPDKDELRDMLSGSSFVQVGKQLGVSDNAIRKHIKSKYGDIKNFLEGN